MSPWERDLLDPLGVDDFDASLSLPYSFNSPGPRTGIAGAASLDKGSPMEAGISGAADGDVGTAGALVAPADDSTGAGGMMSSGTAGVPFAGGMAGSLGGASGSVPLMPNGSTSAPFPQSSAGNQGAFGPATGLVEVPSLGSPGSHVSVRPFLSGPWPSDTPPTNPSADSMSRSGAESVPAGLGPQLAASSAQGGRAGTLDLVDSAPGVYDHSISSDSAYSEAGVRYFDGQLNLASTDLSSSGFGTLWGQTRDWSNGSPPSSFNGTGVIDTTRPFVLRPNGDDSEIVVVTSAINARFFTLSGGVYVPQFFVQDQLTHPSGEFVLTDTMGDTLHFYDFTASQVNQRGQFKSYTDAMGNAISVVSLTSDGKVAEVQRSDSTSGITESYLYTYLASPDLNAGQLVNVTLRRQTNGGAWSTVRQVNYDYYDGTSQKPYGNLGDLRTATILDGNNNAIDTSLYRYYTSADAGSIGYVHGLKYVFSPQSYARLAAGVTGPLTATDSQIAPYADKYFEYDPNSQSVTKAVVQGKGNSSTNGG